MLNLSMRPSLPFAASHPSPPPYTYVPSTPLPTTQVSLRSTAAWALSNLAKGARTSARPFFEAGLFPLVVQTLAQGVSGVGGGYGGGGR
jgi:hypothetical protein